MVAKTKETKKSRASKMGQNFLRDVRILEKIADFAEIKKEDTVLEIGPGEGTLTQLLLDRAQKVIAVEKDSDLAEKLQQKFSLEIEKGKLKIINGDILEIENLLEIAKFKIENYILVGNIPYYITGEIFRKFLESENQPGSLTFVIQKEVAQRIIGPDARRGREADQKRRLKESILSISIKAYGEPDYGGIIKAGSFSPSPKVDSAIISVRNINKSRFSSHSAKASRDKEIEFFKILKKGFAHKRKFLARNLEIGPDILEKCGIQPKVRAENLTLEQWFKLTEILNYEL